MAETLASPFNAAWSEVDRVAPAVTSHPRMSIATAAVALAGGFAYYSRYEKNAVLSHPADLHVLSKWVLSGLNAQRALHLHTAPKMLACLLRSGCNRIQLASCTACSLANMGMC